MPEFRKDPIVNRWVIISTERSKRNSDWVSKPRYIKIDGFCPFCEGNEDKTPPEIYAVRSGNTKPNSPGWQIRVVPNKFPALESDGELKCGSEGIFKKTSGIGAHEVFIETPDHFSKLADFSLEHICDVLWVFRERMVTLKSDQRLKYIIIFKNEGHAAGASLEHSHSQLIATPIVPKAVIEKLEGFRRYYNQKTRCVFCEIIEQELKLDVRIVAQSKSYVAFEPFASRFPFETWILPHEHRARFEDIKYEYCYELAVILKNVLNKINDYLDNPPYNFILHSCPLTESKDMNFHWHIEIIPKLSNIAGFEKGSGIYINPVAPENAAKWLRGES